MPAFPADHLSILSLPSQFLRASDAANIDPVTLQRCNVAFDVMTGKPPQPKCVNDKSACDIVECWFEDEHYQIEWSDGKVSSYSVGWVEEALRTWEGEANNANQVYVAGLTEDALRSSPQLNMAFDDAITEKGMAEALSSLYKYGILLVTSTPIDDYGAGIAALSSALGGGSIKNDTNVVSQYSKGLDNAIVLPNGTDGPLRTLYGTVYCTSSSGQADGASLADSSFGHEALPLHTDMTYSRDPPGLQIFTMVQPSAAGGESVYCDGFAAADRLRRINPDAFNFLSTTPRRYYCVDKFTGWHMEASGPIIGVEKGEIVQIRHNDLDRMPDLPPKFDCSDDEIDEFYERQEAAHAAWDSILADDDMRLVVGLRPGDTVVVANQVSNVWQCLASVWRKQCAHLSDSSFSVGFMVALASTLVMMPLGPSADALQVKTN
jgi:Taurine catabolism dioxygenase TauD, TfdA family